ncbi:MAG: DUF5685 family protein [Sedimentibacter sp.]|uniref:DUF5685 family protein n=1 Tax=Sedimentibacter sp. TaxID=1960295 RepID=UPI00298165AF|nr:DUF5685 family protein [Sedimentibacter sp.]MDW5300672.1 DUF5685 family protein [Sedimentibacter sp.]
MFGYVTINKMELKFKEYYSYKGYYCGLCKCLKTQYSNKSRFTLNYDMTFLILLLSSLYEPANKLYNERCIAHPSKKQLIIQNEITEYAASINIMLSYYNMIDNWLDDKDYKSLAISKALQQEFKKSNLKLPEKSKIIKKRLDNISLLEKNNSQDLDAVSNEFGHLMEEVILYKKDEWEKNLRKTGFFLGKYIYFLDAYEDMKKDEENKSYNPFNNLDVENKQAYAKELLMLNLSFLSEEIEKLPLVQDKAIIDNIIYSGMLNKLNKANIENKKEINK